MSELKACPFCGGEAVLHEMRYGEGKQYSVFGVFCVTDAEAEYQHGHFIDNFATEAEAIEVWNTRAERTCHIVKSSRKYVLSDGTELFEDGCSECNGYIGDGENYCANCGARVEEEK